VIKLGVLGFSDGNGHPFSFSAIVNGFDDAAFADCGWSVIHNYLRLNATDAGFDDARVTHVWMPDRSMGEKLARGCLVENVVAEPSDMIGAVDAVIIARDDAQSHRPLAEPFLKAGIPVFIDKPLTLDASELSWFRPYLDSGQLISCSGLRYSPELDSIAAQLADFGTILGLRAAIVNGWDKYAIHGLEGGLLLTGARAISVRRIAARHGAFIVALSDGATFTVDMLGPEAPVINLSVLGSRKIVSVDLRSNFVAFRRCLRAFIGMVASRKPPIDPATTVNLVRTLIAGLEAVVDGPAVKIEAA
jgi:predicted dehydrogenase